MNRTRQVFSVIVSCFLSTTLLFLAVVSPHSVRAQDPDIKAERAQQPAAQAPEGPVILPSRILKIGAAQKRTPVQMQEAQLLQPQEFGEQEIGEPGSTISRWEYAAQKEAANRSRITAPFLAMLELSPEPLAAPVLKTINVNGSSQGTSFPPDTHGAIGNTHFVEVTNRQVEVFNLAGTKVSSRTLATFFGYTAQSLFDPRVLYDKNWDRWIITAEARPETTTIQKHFIAISTTANPMGTFWLYNVDVNYLNDIDEFFDFPQLGMDQDSILVTANIFEGSPLTFKTARLFLLAKARLYNGLALSIPIFTNLVGSTAPPIVLDQSAKTFLLAAPTAGAALKLYTLRDSSSTNCTGCTGPTLTGPVNVPVAAYGVPPSALQPAPCTGATHDLDTLDARFSNATTQNQNFLFAIHTINVAGRSRPRWYQINTSTNAVVKTSVISSGASKFDFNASIAANETNDVFVTYSSSSTTIKPEVRFSGRKAADPPAIPIGSLAFTSLFCITGNTNAPPATAQRWGDYSAVSVDPLNPNLAWMVNENVNSASLWGSRIVRFGF